MRQKADNQEVESTAAISQQDRQELDSALETLSPVQLLACTMLAEYSPPSVVLSACIKEYGAESINLWWINRVSSPVSRPRAYRCAIDAIRAHYRDMRDEPIMDPAWRMRQRRRIVENAIKAGEYDQAREALADVERLGGSMPYQAPAGVNVQVNIDNAPASPARARILAMMAESGDGPLLLALDAQQTPEDAPGSTIDIIDIVPGH